MRCKQCIQLHISEPQTRQVLHTQRAKGLHTLPSLSTPGHCHSLEQNFIRPVTLQGHAINKHHKLVRKLWPSEGLLGRYQHRWWLVGTPCVTATCGQPCLLPRWAFGFPAGEKGWSGSTAGHRLVWWVKHLKYPQRDSTRCSGMCVWKPGGICTSGHGTCLGLELLILQALRQCFSKFQMKKCNCQITCLPEEPGATLSWIQNNTLFLPTYKNWDSMCFLHGFFSNMNPHNWKKIILGIFTGCCCLECLKSSVFCTWL